MTTTLLTPVASPTIRVSAVRRAAVGVTGLLSCALPLVWGCGTTVELLTGAEPDHRFHQLTGQGLLLSAIWLGGLVPLVRAGLRGRRPSTRAGLHVLAFFAATLLAGVLAPGNGGAALAGVTVVTGGLLWLALPVRPRLAGAFADGLDVVLAPVALLTAALLVPFALGQADLQATVIDEHADLSHYFDMAWTTLGLVGLAAAGALSRQARVLSVWSAAGLVVVGAARAAFTPDVTWSALAIALGALGLAVAAVRHGTSGNAS